jgi:hypothetical protein
MTNLQASGRDALAPEGDVERAVREEGAWIARNVFERKMFTRLYADVRTIASSIAPGAVDSNGTIDEAWMTLARRDRALAGLLYDGLKHSLALRYFATHEKLTELVARALGTEAMALVDLNFRIDAPSESQYLFSWHQDYWFSICSPKALVAWIPMMPLDDEVGGIDYLPLTTTEGRLLKVKRAAEYRSYSDSVLLDEELPSTPPETPQLNLGDALLFTFDVLHRSRPNRSRDRCRWTAQLRFVAYDDPAFLAERYRPGVVTKEKITYLERMEGKDR